MRAWRVTRGAPLGGLLVMLFGVIMTSAQYDTKTVRERIHNDADLSQFDMLLSQGSDYLKSVVDTRPITIFAPTNKAFQQSPHVIKDMDIDDLILYHMVNMPIRVESLTQTVFGMLEGNPPLWITRRLLQHNQAEVYINNAKIDRRYSDFNATIGISKFGKEQALHKIDSVMEMLRNKKNASKHYVVNALGLLRDSKDFDLGQYSIENFADSVEKHGLASLFSNESRNTYFIPVDSGYKHFDKVDRKVIEGHVIPDHVLFTAPTPNEKEFGTSAFSEDMQVTIAFNTDHKRHITIVKSNTRVGDNAHQLGVVMAEVVRPNIPVRNGVVHLIDRPLMVIDATVQEFIEDREDGPLFEFHRVLTTQMNTDFIQDLGKLKNVTLFAPSNEAWRNPAAQAAIRNRTLLHEVVRLHIVPQRLPLQLIKNHTVGNIVQGHHQVRHHSGRHLPHKEKLYQVAAIADRKNLFFNVAVFGSNQTLTVEGGGVNATVIQPDIAATNGVIHIIDRVLGIASHTVKEKLATDPSLSKTFQLGENGFNERLNDNNTRYTYFVPRNYAWHVLEMKYPSTYKKLFMRDFQYHVSQILERHLVVGPSAYTIADIKRMSLQGPVKMHTVRDELNLLLKDKAGGYYLQWQNEEILVHRPDVECTNGIIHVLDGVFLKESDIRVTAGVSGLSIAPHLLSFVVARWLLL